MASEESRSSNKCETFSDAATSYPGPEATGTIQNIKVSLGTAYTPWTFNFETPDINQAVWRHPIFHKPLLAFAQLNYVNAEAYHGLLISG